MTSPQTTDPSPTPEPPPARDDLVLYEIIEPHIAKITLNRPERRNAILSPEMNEQLYAKFLMAQDDDQVKVIILAGAGAHFCAGEDVRRVPVETYGLKKGQKLPQSYRIRGMSKSQSQNQMLYCDKVVIAACQGACIGLGFMIPLCCDMIIAADNARFARVQHRLGFAGMDMILPVALLKMGINRGYEAMMTGRTLTATELKQWGVVSSVVPAEQLEAEALRYARAVALHSTDGLMLGRQAKKLFWQMLGVTAYQTFINVGHPLFTNLVWREDEFNLLKARNEVGPREALDQLHKRWADLGFG